MNWDAIGAIGNIIGAFAVVVSLIYLAIQIRTQNKQAKLSAFHEMSRELRVVTVMFASKDVSDIFVRANHNYDSITEAESIQLIVLVTNIFRAWENAFIENRDGNLDKNIWEALAREYTQIMSIPSFQHIWAIRKQNYEPNFQHYVDSIEAGEFITR